MNKLRSPFMFLTLLTMFVLSACNSGSSTQTATVDEPVIEIEPTIEVSPTPRPTIVPRPPSPKRLTWHGMIYNKNKDQVILTGGRKCAARPPQCNIKQDAWIFDVASGSWEMIDMGITEVEELDMTAFDPKTNQLFLMALKIDDTYDRTDIVSIIYNVESGEISQQPMPEEFEVRIESGMVFHPISEKVIVFGGQTIMSPTYNDTWVLDTSNYVWEKLETNGAPLDRGRMAMVYDPDANKVLLHGGSSGDLFDGESLHDTWEFDIDTVTWSEIETADFPQLLANADGAYDAQSKKFILFGRSIEGENETWAFDYSSKTWTKMNPPLSPKIHHAGEAVYSPALDRILSYGGTINWESSPNSSTEFWAYDFDNDVWEIFDGFEWQPLLPE